MSRNTKGLLFSKIVYQNLCQTSFILLEMHKSILWPLGHKHGTCPSCVPRNGGSVAKRWAAERERHACIIGGFADGQQYDTCFMNSYSAFEEYPHG
jgi:hypothetical protein